MLGSKLFKFDGPEETVGFNDGYRDGCVVVGSVLKLGVLLCETDGLLELVGILLVLGSELDKLDGLEDTEGFSVWRMLGLSEGDWVGLWLDGSRVGIELILGYIEPLREGDDVVDGSVDGKSEGDVDGTDDILGSSLEALLGCDDNDGVLEVYIDGDCDGIVDIDGSSVLVVVGFDDSDGGCDGSKLSVGA